MLFIMKNLKLLTSKGLTKIITSENYLLEGNDIIFDDLNKYIISDNETTIKDQDNNKIYLDNFKYLINDYIFKSIGEIRVEDNLKNVYNFSQIYIDTKKKSYLAQILSHLLIMKISKLILIINLEFLLTR